MPAKDIEDIYELSPLQQGMMFHTLYDPASHLYFEQESYPLQGPVDIPALVRAWRQVVARHPVLRSSFHWEGLDKPVQVVHRDARLPVEVQDWRNVPRDQQEGRLEAYLESDRASGFELSRAPLLRVAFLQTADDLVQFVLSFHHVVLDGWSHRLVMDEVWRYYEAYCAAQDLEVPPARPYSDFISWLQRQDLAGAEGFWRRMLQGFAAPTRLGIDRPAAGTTVAGADQGEQALWLSRQNSTALQRFGRLHRLTLNTLVQGAWAIVLSRYGGDTDVVFGTVVSGRPAALAGVESMVGLFINTLPLRTRVPPDALALPWLRDLQARQLEARDYEYSPLVEIQRCSDVPAGVPLFESLVIFENYPVPDPLQDDGDQPEAGFRLFERTNYPLNFMVTPGARLHLKILYSRPRFDDAAIARMLGHLQAVLVGLAADPDRRLQDLPLLSRPEARQLLVEWNATGTSYAGDACVHELVERQVARTPEATALICGSERISYEALNRRANQLARHLQTFGVGAESRVGLYLERSAELLVGLLAVLKAGGAYLPLDPSDPRARLATMLADGGGVSLVVSRDPILGSLPATGARVVRLDADRDAIDARSHENLTGPVGPENLAYVIYTSGSTGTPKGVMMTHRPLVNLIRWQLRAAPAGTAAPARTLQFAPTTFDVSFQEVFSTWSSGGTLVLAPEEARRDPLALLRFADAERIERLFVPFVALHQLAEVATRTNSAPSRLRDVITAGEQLRITPAIEELFARLPGCRLHNHYGPTESHVVTAHRLASPPGEWPRWVPVGRPISNTQIYLLDRHLHHVPIGVAGELYIGGDCLARGYLARPGLTGERFVPNPFSTSPGARLYRTGDLARYLADGSIEFVGRVDSQIKVRGFRVEPAEIEAALAQHPAVREVVVVARGDTPSERHLVAYIVPTTGDAVTAGEMRSFLARRLPNYMLPQALVQLDRWPLTGSGKLERRALPAPRPTRPAMNRAYAGPRTALERVLADMYADLLGLERVGVNDNFFTDLGGHSLQATQLVSRVRDNFEIDLPVRSVFDNPSVKELARTLLVEDASTRSRLERTAELLLTFAGCSDEEISAKLAANQPLHPEE